MSQAKYINKKNKGDQMLELLINKKENIKTIMLVENGILVEKHEEHENQRRLEGNIYLGKVQNVLSGMQSAFIDIGEEKNTLIKLKDVLPKVDEKNNKLNLENKNITDILKSGQDIVVQIKKDGTLTKGAKVSTHINLPGRFIALLPNSNFNSITKNRK
jgi:ribonuclease G